MGSLDDPSGAFLERFVLEPTGPGVLDGLDFAVKDIFDIAGRVTGCGSPSWARSHQPAADHAAPVQALLAAGGRAVGKVVSDEMAFSLMGENRHYGTPRNAADPRRVPGGSSSGSVAAVAGGVVDFALGSDTGGSVRAPASFCGVLGIRPSHGAIPMKGTTPFAPSYDTPGWFAREAAVMARVGEALGLPPIAAMPSRLLLPTDAWAVASTDAVAALTPLRTRLEEMLDPADASPIAGDEGLTAWRDCFRIRQCAEGWAQHGAWITEARPNLAPNVANRFDYAAGISGADWSDACARRERIEADILAAIPVNTVAAFPTVPGPAPFRGRPDAETDGFRNNAHRLLCIAGHAGLPQISLPAGVVDGGPVGLSLMGPPGSDMSLIALTAELGF
ncbi:MAG: amidase [Pseudomonadota bacterium]